MEHIFKELQFETGLTSRKVSDEAHYFDISARLRNFT